MLLELCMWAEQHSWWVI